MATRRSQERRRRRHRFAQHHGCAARPDTDPTNLHVPLSCTLCLRPSPPVSVSQQGDEAPTLSEVLEDANRRLDREAEELARAMEISEIAEGGGSVEVAEVAEVLEVTQTEEDGTTNLPTDGEAEEDADHGPDAEKMHPDCKQLPEAKNEPQEEELEVSSHDPSPVLYSDPATPAPSSPLVVQSVRGISCSRETNLTRLRLPCGVWLQAPEARDAAAHGDAEVLGTQEAETQVRTTSRLCCSS